MKHVLLLITFLITGAIPQQAQMPISDSTKLSKACFDSAESRQESTFVNNWAQNYEIFSFFRTFANEICENEAAPRHKKCASSALGLHRPCHTDLICFVI